MTALTLYFVDAAPAGSAHGTLQVGGSAPGTATMGTGWNFGTTHAANEFADLAYGSVAVNTSFTTTTGPTTGTGTARCFVTSARLLGTFAAGNWTIALGALMSTIGTSGNATIRARVYRSTNITGSGATEITTATIATGNAAIATGTQQNLSITWAANAFALNNEYLFIELGCEVLSGAVTAAGTTLKLVQDGTHSVVTSAAFTTNAFGSGSQTLYLLGTGLAATGNPTGPDGSCDQILAGGSWGQVLPITSPNGTFNASCATDPSTGIVYLMGNGDGSLSAQQYNPITNLYAGLANPPTGCFGQGAAVFINGVVYCIGGLDGSVGVTKVYSYTVAGAGTYSTSFGAQPDAVNNNGAVAVGSMVYHGGGDSADGAGTPTGHWYKWNPITDVRTSLTSMPAPLGGFACVHLNGFIYCFGGFGTGNTNYAGTTTVYRYNIAADSWTTMGALPAARAGMQACVWNGVIWLAGGLTSAGFATFASDVYTYSVAGDSYTAQASLLTPLWGSTLTLTPEFPAPWESVFDDGPARGRGAPRQPVNEPPLFDAAQTGGGFVSTSKWGAGFDDPARRGRSLVRAAIADPTPLSATAPPTLKAWLPTWDERPARGAWLSRRPSNETTPFDPAIPGKTAFVPEWDAPAKRGSSATRAPTNEQTPFDPVVPGKTAWVPGWDDRPARGAPAGRGAIDNAGPFTLAAAAVLLATFLAPDASAAPSSSRGRQPVNDQLGPALVAASLPDDRPQRAAPAPGRGPVNDPVLDQAMLAPSPFVPAWDAAPVRGSSATRPAPVDPTPLDPFFVPAPTSWVPWDPPPARGLAATRPAFADPTPLRPTAPNAPTSWVDWNAPPARGVSPSRQPVNDPVPLRVASAIPPTSWVPWDAPAARGASATRQPANESTPFDPLQLPGLPSIGWLPDAPRTAKAPSHPVDNAPALGALSFGAFPWGADGPQRAAAPARALPDNAPTLGALAPLLRPFLADDARPARASSPANRAGADFVLPRFVPIVLSSKWGAWADVPARGSWPRALSFGDGAYFLDGTAPDFGPLCMHPSDAALLLLAPTEVAMTTLYPTDAPLLALAPDDEVC